MKKALAICLFIVTIINTQAQIRKELKITGVSDNIEKSFLPGDQISFNGPSTQSNLHVKITNIYIFTCITCKYLRTCKYFYIFTCITCKYLHVNIYM